MSDIRSEFHYDTIDDTLIENRIQDVEPILEANKKLFNSAQSGWKGDMHHVGTIPQIVVEQIMKEKGISFREFLMDEKLCVATLNDPEYLFLRTKSGKL